MDTEEITFLLLGIIILVFLVDFILNSRKKSLEKSVEKFVENDKTKKKGWLNVKSLKKGWLNVKSFFWAYPIIFLNWILKRKKNITISLIIIPILKVLTHFTLYRKTWSSSGRGGGPYTSGKHNLGSHFDDMFDERLELYIPITILFLLVIWFFNDKIKAK